MTVKLRRDANGDLIRFDVVNSLVEGGLTGHQDKEGNWSFDNFAEGVTPPTDAEIDAEITRIDAEYSARDYARNRQDEYPSVLECVHAILDDELDALQEKRQAIKAKYPK